MAADSISGLMAFTAGFLSFLSPCLLPMIPVYVTYLAGGSDLAAEGERPAWFNGRVFFHALIFSLGFSLVFISLGLSATYLGQLLLRHLALVRKASGVLIFLFGLHMTGWLRLPLLERGFRWRGVEQRAVQARTGLARSFLLGVAFAAGWSPCAGPILGAILLYTSTVQTLGTGARLLLLYALGLALPFLAVALFLEPFSRYLVRLQRRGRWLQIISGLFLMAMGVLVYLNLFQRLSRF